MLGKLINQSIMMLGSGDGNDIMYDLAFKIMSINYMAGKEGGRYIRKIISEGWWRFIISRSQIEFEYFKQT